MTTNPKHAFLLAAMVGAAGAAQSQTEVFVSSNIATSTTWTANNTYNLQDQIYVLPGATLTIEAGTVIASTTGLGGSLAVSKGAQIFVRGTEQDPVIMTSKADVQTWTAGNPKTGNWRVAANEWGNLTIMGDALISENATPGNVPTCSASNTASMEGLIANPSFPGRTLYGGGNDDDDSGSISYLSLRFGGRVIGLNNELNGLSLGGIGRATDIHHVEVMNNVDDGIEIWGGTVNLANFSIWNVGDDSFDVDQGWRGKAQFGLIVQGYSLSADQGSGVGDNCFEVDGAEDSDWQPVTTTTIYNCTVIGQPVSGDHGTAWRDNARVQYRNCIFMDLGEDVVRFDNVDGDGANGYGHNGTLSWANTWTTDWNATPAHANDCPAGTYPVQNSGKLAEIRDSVFFRNLKGGATVGDPFDPAYSEALARGIFAPALNNQIIAGFADASAPVAQLTRGAPVAVPGSRTMLPVTFLDPRPRNLALSNNTYAPSDGFFASANYRGAFAPQSTWLGKWTASYAFGMTPADSWTDKGCGTAGSTGDPEISGAGTLSAGGSNTVVVSNVPAGASGALFIGFNEIDLPLLGVRVKCLPLFSVPFNANGSGEFSFTFTQGLGAGLNLCFQAIIADGAGPQGLSASNLIVGRTE